MVKTASKIAPAPIALTEEMGAMADYIRSAEGRAAVERGLLAIREGRIVEGRDALAAELKRRAAARRRMR